MTDHELSRELHALLKQEHRRYNRMIPQGKITQAQAERRLKALRIILDRLNHDSTIESQRTR